MKLSHSRTIANQIDGGYCFLVFPFKTGVYKKNAGKFRRLNCYTTSKLLNLYLFYYVFCERSYGWSGVDPGVFLSFRPW